LRGERHAIAAPQHHLARLARAGDQVSIAALSIGEENLHVVEAEAVADVIGDALHQLG
jgi:hypothetical protein